MSEPELTSETQYEAAIAEIARLLEMEPDKGTPEYDEVQRLSQMISSYEQQQVRAHDTDDFPVEDPEEEE